MKTWILKIREWVLSRLGIEVDLDKYDYIIEGNPLRGEYTVYWMKDIVYSAEFPEYWYKSVDSSGEYARSTTIGRLPKGGYRVRNKEKEQEILRQLGLEKIRDEKVQCVATFTRLRDPQEQYTELEMLLRMQEDLKQAAPEYVISYDRELKLYLVVAKRKNRKAVEQVVNKYRSSK